MTFERLEALSAVSVAILSILSPHPFQSPVTLATPFWTTDRQLSLESSLIPHDGLDHPGSNGSSSGRERPENHPIFNDRQSI